VGFRSQNVAKKFAVELSGRRLSRVFAIAMVSRKHIFAVCIERGESEIIVDPKYLQEVQLSAVAAAPSLDLGQPTIILKKSVRTTNSTLFGPLELNGGLAD
jgi:hypothetical protein